MNTVKKKTFINISDIGVYIEYKDIKNLHIGVYPPNGKVRVASPLHMNDDAIRLAVISRLSWIKKQIKSFQEQKRESKSEMVSGESHYFLGKRYLLDVIYDSNKHFIVLKHSKIELHIKKNTTTENRYKLLLEWYRIELKKIVEKLIKKWEEKLNIELNGWQIKKMKTKWGSCNIEKKYLTLNLYLARVPVECIEYIVVHEIVHLFERHHNNNFEKYMDSYLPQWREYRKKLQEISLSYQNWKER